MNCTTQVLYLYQLIVMPMPSICESVAVERHQEVRRMVVIVDDEHRLCRVHLSTTGSNYVDEVAQCHSSETQEEPRLTIDEAYRAAYHFIVQYYARERTTRLMLMLHSMGLEGDRMTNDPATWDDWLASVEKARTSLRLPAPAPPLD